VGLSRTVSVVNGYFDRNLQIFLADVQLFNAHDEGFPWNFATAVDLKN